MKKLVLAFAIFSGTALSAQVSVVTEFQAMPQFPLGAKDAYKVSQTELSDGHSVYKGPSALRQAYEDRIVADSKPYEAIQLEKGKKSEAPAQGAANDFSDLNSPEMQAKIAKMSDAEKVKFAMEVQARIQNNKNVQKINTINKPNPMAGQTAKIIQAATALMQTLEPFKPNPFPGYAPCNGLCKDANKACAEKTKACEGKISRDFYASEILRYNAYIKNAQAQYSIKKPAYEAELKAFDAQVSRYPKEDVAGDMAIVLGTIGQVAGQLKAYEKQGAEIVLKAKNDIYCAKEY